MRTNEFRKHTFRYILALAGTTYLFNLCSNWSLFSLAMLAASQLLTLLIFLSPSTVQNRYKYMYKRRLTFFNLLLFYAVPVLHLFILLILCTRFRPRAMRLFAYSRVGFAFLLALSFANFKDELKPLLPLTEAYAFELMSFTYHSQNRELTSSMSEPKLLMSTNLTSAYELSSMASLIKREKALDRSPAQEKAVNHGLRLVYMAINQFEKPVQAYRPSAHPLQLASPFFALQAVALKASEESSAIKMRQKAFEMADQLLSNLEKLKCEDIVTRKIRKERQRLDRLIANN